MNVLEAAPDVVQTLTAPVVRFAPAEPVSLMIVRIAIFVGGRPARPAVVRAPSVAAVSFVAAIALIRIVVCEGMASHCEEQ